MNTESNVMPGSSAESQAIAPAAIPETRLLFWSVRRELWENRSIYLAPLGVAGVAVLGFSLSAIAGIWERALRIDVTRGREAIAGPYDMAAGLMMLTSILVSVFYCLDALHGERRDRSILFWKSLPVSDLTTVLAKASIPLVVVPVIAFAITIAMHVIMLVVSSAAILASGQSVAAWWTELSVGRMWLLLLYHFVTAHALWPFPVYCWLLLVSGWARRAAILWAALPLVAIGGVERIVFQTWYFATLTGSRLIGGTPDLYMGPPEKFPTGPMTHIAPWRFLGSPGLWVGLAVAAAFLAVAVRLRRNRGPI
jgi:ABC-2 type transport system permease protein